MNDDFSFLSCVEVIDGVLSFVNVSLMEQIVIPNLQHIGGNKMIPGINSSLRVLNVSGADIIFPRLTNISRGDAEFEIMNDVCGYRGVDWSMILSDGQLVNQYDRCNGKCI